MKWTVCLLHYGCFTLFSQYAFCSIALFKWANHSHYGIFNNAYYSNADDYAQMKRAMSTSCLDMSVFWALFNSTYANAFGFLHFSHKPWDLILNSGLSSMWIMKKKNPFLLVRVENELRVFAFVQCLQRKFIKIYAIRKVIITCVFWEIFLLWFTQKYNLLLC